jgi:flavin reductase (DIM6/NTAB) family NADH-FMN oxidoreductase RutF
VTEELKPIDSGEFRHVLGHFPTGVTVVAATTPSGPAGLAVGSFFSVSLDPPLVGFCVGKESSSWARVRETGHFVVNVLGDHQVPVSGQFASRADDKFEGLEWSPAASNGGPRLDGCLAHIDCSIETIYDGGDHDIVVGRVLAMEAIPNGAGPLLFFRGKYGQIVGVD